MTFFVLKKFIVTDLVVVVVYGFVADSLNLIEKFIKTLWCVYEKFGRLNDDVNEEIDDLYSRWLGSRISELGSGSSDTHSHSDAFTNAHKQTHTHAHIQTHRNYTQTHECILLHTKSIARWAALVVAVGGGSDDGCNK